MGEVFYVEGTAWTNVEVVMYFRSGECNWKIIGKEGEGRFIPNQWSAFKLC